GFSSVLFVACGMAGDGRAAGLACGIGESDAGIAEGGSEFEDGLGTAADGKLVHQGASVGPDPEQHLVAVEAAAVAQGLCFARGTGFVFPEDGLNLLVHGGAPLGAILSDRFATPIRPSVVMAGFARKREFPATYQLCGSGGARRTQRHEGRVRTKEKGSRGAAEKPHSIVTNSWARAKRANGCWRAS